VADDQTVDPFAALGAKPVPAAAQPPDAFASLGATPAQTPTASSSEPSGPGFWGAVRQALSAQVDPAIGLAKSVGSTALGAARMLSGDVPVPQSWLDALKPSDFGQQVGKTVGDVAQFLIPSGAIGDVVKGAEIASPVVRTLAKAGLEGASSGVIGQAQSGDTSSTAVPAALGAGGTIVGAGGNALGQALAQRSESALIKAGKSDVADGFSVGNVFKYGLGGTLQQTYEKGVAKLQQLGQQLKATLGASPATVSINDALDQTAAELKGQAASKFGSNTALQSAIDKVRTEIQTTLGLMRQGGVKVGPNGDVALDIGNQLKQGAGTQGAWLMDPSGKVHGDPDQQALGQVYTTLYGKLKTMINDGAQGAAAPINKQMSDIIPITNAVIRRIPVAARANPISLIDAISLATGHIPVGILNRALLSGRVANAVNTASRVAPQTIGAATAAAGSQLGGGGSE